MIRLNPQRRKMILAKTGWPDLFEGTLNLEVDPCIVSELGTRQPYIEVDPDLWTAHGVE